jgi:enoyl-[acyl-carrier-protein] reductase (NADH)
MLFRDRERARSSAPSQSDDAFNERLNKTTTLRRTGAASEIGAVVVLLASDMASYITGTNVVVDGGFTAVKAI